MRLPIRLKLAAVLGVPVAGLVLTTITEVRGSVAEARTARDQTAVALTVLGPESVATALQVERDTTVVTMVGMQEAIDLAVEDVPAAREATDRAVASFEAYLDERGPAARSAYTDSLDQLTLLDDIRAAADGYDGEHTIPAALSATDAVYVDYRRIITALFDGNSQISAFVEDAELRRGTQLIDFAARQLDTRGDLTRALLLGQLSSGGLDTTEEFRRIGEAIGRYDNGLRQIRLTVAGPYRSAGREVLANEDLQRFRDQADVAIETGQVDVAAVFAASSRPRGEGYDGFRDGVARVLQARADEVNRVATTRERWFVALGLLVVGATMTITWFVARSIVRPLHSLTRQAGAIARQRLPEAVRAIADTPLGNDVSVPALSQVEVQTNDEVADVAQRLNVVQQAAVDLAVEQAVLRRNIADSLMNLGRRNQSLLGRQLDFITELESRETDPDALANLFRLDHLATRMRRNAESLLVLAGVEPTRTWTAPVSLVDVIRAALGEVEDYRRVKTDDVVPVAVMGGVAADLAHVIAELLENALRFSPPQGIVDLEGYLDATAYTLRIIDTGLGMFPEDMTAANRRLAGAESFTVAPSRYLGHYVAGHIARRHGMSIRLDRTPGGGVTATLSIPPSALAAGTDVPAAVTGAVGATLPRSGLPGWAPASADDVFKHLPRVIAGLKRSLARRGETAGSEP
jgi:signal transduction histidine kinase